MGSEENKIEYGGNFMTISLYLFQTVAVAVVMLAIGSWIQKKIPFLQKYCIPAPVVGGMVFAIIVLLVNLNLDITISVDEVMRNICMTLFFTSVGYTASFKLLKKGGMQVLVLAGITALLILFQDLLGVGLAKAFDLNPLL